MFRVLFVILFTIIAQTAYAQHVRLYAVVLANEDPANFMTGSSMGSGLWQSDDTGRSWKQLGWKHIKAFSMDLDSNGRVLYLAAGNGVLKSTDHGESWKVMTDWRVAEVTDVLIVKRYPGIVIASTAHGIIKSTDHGMTWQSSHSGIAQPFTSRLYLDNDILYACNEEGLYRSHDLGTSWKLLRVSGSAVRHASAFKDLILTVGEKVSLIRFDGTLSSAIDTLPSLWVGYYSASLYKRFIAGAQGIAELSDNGIYFKGPKDVQTIASIGETVFVGTLGNGIWVSKKGTEEWRSLALPKSQVWTLKAVYMR